MIKTRQPFSKNHYEFQDSNSRARKQAECSLEWGQVSLARWWTHKAGPAQKKELKGSKVGGRIISTVDNSGIILIFLCAHRLIFRLLKYTLYGLFWWPRIHLAAGTVGWTPGWGTKILHATRQLSPHTSTTESSPHNWRAHAPQRKIPHGSTKVPHAATKTQCRQINK